MQQITTKKYVQNSMITLIEFFTGVSLWFLCLWTGKMFPEKWNNFSFLQFKPFTCTKCFTFWLTAVIGVFWLFEGLLITGWFLILMAALTAVAMTIDEYEKTVSIEDEEKTRNN